MPSATVRPTGPRPPGLPPCSDGSESDPGGVSRRAFLGTSAAAPAGLALAASAGGAAVAGDEEEAGGTAAVRLTLNGDGRGERFDPRVTLLDLLRERIGLTGTKKGCDHGACGACTVHIERPGDGGPTRQLACLTFAATLDGASVTTVEGLAPGGTDPEGDLHPLQEAFLRCDAYQCGFCTPGQLMSGTALIAEGHAGSRDEVREWMSGNLCRCAAYPNIVAAVRQAAGEEEPADPSAAVVILSDDSQTDGEG